MREDICRILREKQIDLVCIFSIWPETFCYTLSEAEVAGIPVLATDIGALGERIREEQTGWLVAPDMPPKEILQRLDGIFADPEQYDRVRDRVATFRHKTLSQMAGEYDALYQTFPLSRETWQPFDAQLIYNGYVMGQTVSNGGIIGSDAELIQRMNAREAELLAVQRSTEYKLANFIRRQNFPGKGLAKKMVRWVYRAYKKLRRKK